MDLRMGDSMYEPTSVLGRRVGDENESEAVREDWGQRLCTSPEAVGYTLPRSIPTPPHRQRNDFIEKYPRATSNADVSPKILSNPRRPQKMYQTLRSLFQWSGLGFPLNMKALPKSNLHFSQGMFPDGHVWCHPILAII